MDRQQVAQFVNQFLPKSEPQQLANGMNIYLTPHGLLHDFEGRYPYRFTMDELIACLDGYLALIEPVIEFMDREKPSIYGHPRVHLLHHLHHEPASELMLAYFERTPRDENFPQLLEHIIQIDALGQVEHFEANVDPENEALMIDSRKRIAYVREVLQKLVREYHQLNK